jgi:hypothetical protein
MIRMDSMSVRFGIRQARGERREARGQFATPL